MAMYGETAASHCDVTIATTLMITGCLLFDSLLMTLLQSTNSAHHAEGLVDPKVLA
jgi:hypothetical protein